MREFSVSLGTRLKTPWPCDGENEGMDDALLNVLLEDARALGPVTWANTGVPVLGARFNVKAEDARRALEEGQAIFQDALRAIGIEDPLDLVSIELKEVDPEQAAAKLPV